VTTAVGDPRPQTRLVVGGELGMVVDVPCRTAVVGVVPTHGLVVGVVTAVGPGADVVGGVVAAVGPGTDVVGEGAEVVEVVDAGTDVVGEGAEVVEVVDAGTDVVGEVVEVVVVATTPALTNVTSVTPGPTVTPTRREERLGVLETRSVGSTAIAVTLTPISRFSVIDTSAPARKLPATEQNPPGAGPAGTFTAMLPTMNTKLVPALTPGPATLHSLT